MTHYHVVEFVQGCLNDYDSGPYETLYEARKGIEWFMEGYEEQYTPAGEDRYESGIRVLRVEECTGEECLEELEPVHVHGMTDDSGEVYGG